MATSPIPMDFRPGFNRDGTRTDNDRYLDGQWCRFYRGRPQKMGGYRFVATEIPGKVRTLHVDPTGGTSRVMMGSSNGFYQFDMNTDYGVTPLVDRTPAGMTANPNRLWQISQMFDAAGSNSKIIVHPNINLDNIDSAINYTVYVGDVGTNAQLVALNPTDGRDEVCGGVCVIPPYLFQMCNNGFLTWSGPNLPFTFSISSGGGGEAGARVAYSKIVRGMPFRSSQGPAGVFWSLNSVVRAQFVGGAAQWAFNTVSSHTSVLSSNAFVEYEGSVYWPGVDKFFVYDGAVREIPNEFNSEWFFNNVNMRYRQKVFGFSIPRWGETWWCFPFGNSEEPNKAIIYNHKYKVWYDTDLPRAFRTAGVLPNVINIPMMASEDYYDSSKSWIWVHEIGTDEVNPSNSNAVRSYFETGELSMPETGGDQNLRIDQIDLDMIQSGIMSVSVVGRFSQRGGESYTPEVYFEPGDYYVELKQERRHMRLRFESNDVGGHYKVGKPLLYMGPGSKRRGP